MPDNKLILFILTIILFTSCKEKDKTQDSWENKFQDVEIRKIYELKDARDSQNLIEYLFSENSMLRTEAALAFASVQDSMMIDALGEVLINDSIATVRRAASFALGQTRHRFSIPHLQNVLNREADSLVLSEVIKAFGKCSFDEKSLSYLINKQKETKGFYGAFMWALYYAGLNNVFIKGGDELAIMLIAKSDNEKEKLAASNYLSRFNKRDFSDYKNVILSAIENENQPFIKDNLVKSLIGLTDAETFNLMQILITEKELDYRVYISVLKVLTHFSYLKVNEYFWEALNHPNQAVIITASAYLKKNVPISAFRQLINAAKIQDNFTAKVDLLIRCKKLESTKEVDDYILEQLAIADNEYKIAGLLEAEAAGKFSIPLLQKLTLADTAAIIKTSAFNGLLNQLEKAEFIETLKEDSVSKTSYLDTFKKAILSGDVSLVYLGALAIRNEKLPLKELIDDFQFLNESMQNLELPLEIEAWIELQKTINYLEGNDVTNIEIPKNNEKINWNKLHDISNDENIKIITSKGDILIELKVESAPGTVAMFIDLLEKNFYNGKFFHRNVPDFVIQGGCPRGDGFGGLSKTIRSEFSYYEYNDEGMVGIASAGKDTESCQFFITHTPTPHLNGKYTIFAKVKKGMKVVHQLEVGDQIIEIVLKE